MPDEKRLSALQLAQQVFARTQFLLIAGNARLDMHPSPLIEALGAGQALRVYAQALCWLLRRSGGKREDV